MADVAGKPNKTSVFESALLSLSQLTLNVDVDPGRQPAFEWLNQKLRSLSIHTVPDFVERNNAAAARWLQWSSSHPDIRVVTIDIPQGILPLGMSGRLHDGKVFVRGRPDDAIYNANSEIRDRVARGNCFVELSSGGKTTIHCVIRALKKFTGGLGDDDDDQSGDDYLWKKYFRKPMEDAKIVVCTPKMNGEAAHLGALRVGSDYYVCAGSKNVHLLFRNREDLSRYDLNQPRYGIASEVCFCILETLEQLSERQRIGLLEFMVNSNSMAVFEMLSPDHPHIEDFSTLDANKLKFIAWTSCSLEEDALSELCHLPPDSGIELAKIFGLDAIDYDVIKFDDVELRMNEIRQKHGVEGEVLFFLDEDRWTFGLLKKKSVWYIIVRAIREKLRYAVSQRAKNGASFNLCSFEKKLQKRLSEIQSWLHLDDITRQAWEHLAVEFLRWSFASPDNCVKEVFSMLNGNFPALWIRFLKETGNIDEILVGISVASP